LENWFIAYKNEESSFKAFERQQKYKLNEDGTYSEISKDKGEIKQKE
jgi:hypothetical protein